jgi:hypothetical protein
MAPRPLRLAPPVVAGDAFPRPVLVISQPQPTHPGRSKSIALPLRCLTPALSCGGLCQVTLGMPTGNYLMLGAQPNDLAAPVCFNA